MSNKDDKRVITILWSVVSEAADTCR